MIVPWRGCRVNLKIELSYRAWPSGLLGVERAGWSRMLMMDDNGRKGKRHRVLPNTADRHDDFTRYSSSQLASRPLSRIEARRQ